MSDRESYEDIDDYEEDDSIEATPKKQKRKVNYVMTEKRRQAFEKAKKVREENIAKKKAEKEELKRQIEEEREIREKLKKDRMKKQVEKEMKKERPPVRDEDSEDEKPIKSKHTKKQPKIIYESDSSSDTDSSIEYTIKKSKKKKETKQEPKVTQVHPTNQRPTHNIRFI